MTGIRNVANLSKHQVGTRARVLELERRKKGTSLSHFSVKLFLNTCHADGNSIERKKQKCSQPHLVA